MRNGAAKDDAHNPGKTLTHELPARAPSLDSPRNPLETQVLPPESTVFPFLELSGLTFGSLIPAALGIRRKSIEPTFDDFVATIDRIIASGRAVRIVVTLDTHDIPSLDTLRTHPRPRSLSPSSGIEEAITSTAYISDGSTVSFSHPVKGGSTECNCSEAVAAQHVIRATCVGTLVLLGLADSYAAHFGKHGGSITILRGASDEFSSKRLHQELESLRKTHYISDSEILVSINEILGRS